MNLLHNITIKEIRINLNKINNLSKINNLNKTNKIILEILEDLIEQKEKDRELSNGYVLAETEKFKEANSQIENILIELKSNEQIFKNNASKDYKDVIKNLLSKIEMLETKIFPKANLLDSFSKSKS